VTKRIPILLLALLCLSACHRTQTIGPGKRYHFTGRIISIDPRSESAFIYGDEIPGFMDSMGMSYKIRPATTLDKLTPGDVISADVVVQQPNPKEENTESDYWLENVKVTGHVKPPAKPTMWRGSCGADTPVRVSL
jgi:Cu/Ag efflux protein CusF